MRLCNDSRRHTDRRVMRRDIRNYHRIRADPSTVSNAHVSDDLGAGPDENVVADPRALAALGADGHLVLDVNPRTASNRAVDHHAGRMDQHEPRAKLGAPADDAVAADRVELVEEHL